MIKKSSYPLSKLKRKYLLLRSAEILLLALGGSFLVLGLASMIQVDMAFRLTFSALTAAAIFWTGFLTLKLNKLSENRLINFIDRKYPVMQYSTDLLFMDPSALTRLQEIQKQRIAVDFEEVFRTIRFPHQIEKAIIFFIASVVLASVMVSLSHDQRDSARESEHIAQQKTSSAVRLPAAVKEIGIKVNPPAYTGLASYSTNGLHLSIPEGSVVEWEISFTGPAENPKLVLLHGDSVALGGGFEKYRTERSFTSSTLYQFSWTTPSGELAFSDYYKIQIVHDQPPKISVPELSEYIEIRLKDKQSVEFTAKLSDDYGLRDAYIIATVSKGSGESVKFREEKLSFTSPAKIRGRRARAIRQIDLGNIGLEPGDELYFYIEAIDNKIPSSNRSRSGTFFIAVQDTASQTLSIDAGPGVNVMPAYFRSQRQIITDTEQLLREKKEISIKEFNSQSNALGYDQKVLRLKYGEFLGEEFEETIGPNDAQEEEHDHQEGQEEDPIADYKHVHDDAEEATFFTQSIRTKLKTALTAMWEAELHLRTLQPENSLRYQYTALRLLKEISQASRIYVHKTGFDPPPLKEEKRLSGDLSGIENSRHNSVIRSEESYPAIRLALHVLERTMEHPDSTLTVNAKQALLHAGQELATLAIEEPGNYLNALSLIKALNQDTLPPEKKANSLLILRQTFWEILPEKNAYPRKTVQSAHSLDHAFIENLNESGDD